MHPSTNHGSAASTGNVEAARILTDLEIAKARFETEASGDGFRQDPLAAEIRALRQALSSLSLLRCATVGLRA